VKKIIVLLSVTVLLAGTLAVLAKKPPKEFIYTVTFFGDIQSTPVSFSDGVTGDWDGREWSAWSDHAFGSFTFPDTTGSIENCQLLQLDRDQYKRGKKIDYGKRWRFDIDTPVYEGNVKYRYSCIHYETIGLTTYMQNDDTWIAEYTDATIVKRTYIDNEITEVEYIEGANFWFELTRTPI
jgi:hypothetical protein